MFRNAAFLLPFVGREKELDFLDDTLKETLNYQGRIIIIEGEVGIGKTRFLKEFRERIESAPFQIFFGKGADENRFMAPFGSMLTDYFARIDNRSQRIARYIRPDDLANLANLNSTLLEYYPFEITQSRPVGPEVLYSSLFNFFSNLARLYPLVLIIDDVHLLDEEALKFLDYLGCRIEGLPVLVLLATRKVKGEELLPRVSARRLLQRLVLSPLTQETISDVLRKLFGHDIPERFPVWLYEVSNGNPFFVEEILRALIKKNLISNQEGKWEIREYYEDFPLPDNIVSFTRDKIKALDQDGFRFLRASAVLGEEFSERELEELLPDFSRERFLSSLHLLKLEGFVQEKLKGSYRFQHPLVREVLVQDMDTGEKRAFHRTVARVIEELYPDRIDAIAFHKTQELLPKEYTFHLVRFLKTVARTFTQHQNWKKAKGYLRLAQTVAATLSDIAESERLEIAARLFSLKGQTREELPPLDKTIEFINTLIVNKLKHEALDIFNVYTRRLVDSLRFEEAGEMLNKALEVLGEEERLEQWRLRYLRCVLAVKQGKYREAEVAGKKLITDIDPAISPIGRWFPTNLLGGIAFIYGDLEAAKKYYEAALEIANETGNRNFQMTSYGNLGLVLREMGEIHRAVEYCQRHLAGAVELGDDYKVASAHNYLASCALVKKDFVLARAHAQRFRTYAEQADSKEQILDAELKWFYIYFEQQKIEEAKKELANLFRFRIESLSGLHQVELLTARAMVALEEGNLAGAAKFLNSALAIAQANNLHLAEGRVLTQRVRYFIKCGKKTAAKRDFERAKKILAEKKAFLSLARLLVTFGKEWKGKEKDTIMLQGLECFKKMELVEELRELVAEIDKKGFPQAYKFLEQTLKDPVRGKTQEPKLNISTFGGLVVEDPKLKEPIPEKTWGSNKAKELLGLLLVLSKRKGVTREILASYLWPEMGPKDAQNNFHVTLSHLRKVLGSKGIICEEPFYKLDTGRFWVDYLEFEKLGQELSLFKAQGKLHRAEEVARKALKLYQGDFLPEMYSLPIDDEQMVLKRQVKELLLWLSEISKERLEWSEVLINSQRLLQIDPTDERAHRLAMEALFEQGDKGGVIKHYDRLKKILKAELGVGPEPETEKFYQDLKR